MKKPAPAQHPLQPKLGFLMGELFITLFFELQFALGSLITLVRACYERVNELRMPVILLA